MVCRWLFPRKTPLICPLFGTEWIIRALDCSLFLIMIGLECVLGAFWVVWFSKILFGKLSRYVDQEYFIRGEG